MTDGIAPKPGIMGARDACADVRARETEEQRSDEQRFALIVNGVSAGGVDLARGERIPDDVPRCAGYTPGTRRPGVPALLMSDASLGVTNPRYRPGDTATAPPAQLLRCEGDAPGGD